jgi:hypothetical protein
LFPQVPFKAYFSSAFRPEHPVFSLGDKVLLTKSLLRWLGRRKKPMLDALDEFLALVEAERHRKPMPDALDQVLALVEAEMRRLWEGAGSSLGSSKPTATEAGLPPATCFLAP